MAPARLATITLNGTLDRVLVVPALQGGTIQDAQDVVTLAGGKGVNTARTARALGSEVMAAALVAGECGRWIGTLFEREGIPRRLVHLPEGESRVSTIVVDVEARQSTVIHDSSPQVAPNLWPEIRCELVTAVQGYLWVVLAGASLPGLPDSVYADLCRDLQKRGQRVCLDARDQWLVHALPAKPYLVKCNRHEAARTLGRAVNTPEEARDAAREWIRLGVARVVLTLGADGAVAASRRGTWHLSAPAVDALYPIGSGDAVTAGLVVALARGKSLPQAVRYGVALGAANTLVPGSGRCELDALSTLLERTTVRPI